VSPVPVGPRDPRVLLDKRDQLVLVDSLEVQGQRVHLEPRVQLEEWVLQV